MEKANARAENWSGENLDSGSLTPISLNLLKPGEKGRIARISLGENTKGKLQDMGFMQGSLVECAYRSPFGDPTAYFVKGVLIAIRSEEAGKIYIEKEQEMERRQWA